MEQRGVDGNKLRLLWLVGYITTKPRVEAVNIAVIHKIAVLGETVFAEGLSP